MNAEVINEPNRLSNVVPPGFCSSPQRIKVLREVAQVPGETTTKPASFTDCGNLDPLSLTIDYKV